MINGYCFHNYLNLHTFLNSYKSNIFSSFPLRSAETFSFLLVLVSASHFFRQPPVQTFFFCSCSSSDLSFSSLSFRSAFLSFFCSSICTAERRVALFLVTLPFLPVSERHQEQSMREWPFFVYFLIFSILWVVPTNTGIFLHGLNYAEKAELSKCSWYFERKLGVTMHFSEIKKLQFDKKKAIQVHCSVF